VRPAAAAGRKGQRPWFLVVALVAGWLFGAHGLVNGCSLISYYKDDAVAESATSSDDAHHDDFVRLEPWKKALDGAKNRVFPLSAATLVLGGAMVVFAARAMGGRPRARDALIQIACVQALVAILMYALTPDVRAAEDQVERDAGYGAVFRRYAPPSLLVLRTLASALIVLALTRPRARAYFDPAGLDSVPEQ
jgi:hypothetical protein